MQALRLGGAEVGGQRKGDQASRETRALRQRHGEGELLACALLAPQMSQAPPEPRAFAAC
jgi:hypothetical protein